MTDIAPIILSVATLVTAAAGFIMALKSKNQSVVNTSKIDEVHKLVNGLHTKGVADAKELGNLQGRAEQTQEKKEEEKNL